MTTLAPASVETAESESPRIAARARVEPVFLAMIDILDEAAGQRPAAFP